MSDISLPAAIVIVVALLVLAFGLYLLRGGRLRSLDLQLLKGLFSTKWSIDTRSSKIDPKESQPTEVIDEQCAAHQVLKWLQDKINKTDGCYVITESRHENARTAANLYTRLNGEIIATCFFESPDYGRGDFATTVTVGTKFVRITSSDMCNEDITKTVVARFSEFPCTAQLAIVPANVEISKIGGIFCKFPDKSCLAFIALNNVQDNAFNRGLVFYGVIAEQLFRYYDGFVARYSCR